ncbi:ABC transporter permease [Methanosarcina sp. KYL-1]|uniref:nickel ABC transporter permease n=1 Tax=Methanosarcina sp. KYL-1 TaxID=2602068 RepID=UPI00210140CB|nr:nickel ABC transporter permease [Methanosarcina sp. KYL-1]MCQ1535316.1 ABC transporter permease [Methanosarcina sp. KYL-1]
MWNYIAKRLLLISIVIFGVTLITFSAMYLAPGDPAEVIAIARYGQDLSAEQIEAVRETEGLNSSVYIQYLNWLEHVLHLDFGRSLISSDDILEEILLRLPATAELALASLFLSLLIAIPAGTLSSLKQNTLLDNACVFTSLLGVSIPNFWLGLLFIWLFALILRLLPSYGYGSLENLVLPALTLGTSMAAVTTRLTRSSMLEVLKQEYIVAARAKGLDERTILIRHALKNALLPVLTFAGMQLGYLLGGTVIVETIFAWPGLGKLLVDSIFSRDFAMVQGCVLFIAVLFSLSNLAVDILYAVLDPRIRYDKHD